MISAEVARYLWDVNAAARDINDFVAGGNLDRYLSDKMLRRAVERQFEIIGEALAGLRRSFPEVAALIPELAQAIAFRNALIHGYASIDDGMVWQIIHTHLPPLQAKVEELLQEAPPPEVEGEGT
jgi:uncharacterized protein with HEPN domain